MFFWNYAEDKARNQNQIRSKEKEFYTIWFYAIAQRFLFKKVFDKGKEHYIPKMEPHMVGVHPKSQNMSSCKIYFYNLQKKQNIIEF